MTRDAVLSSAQLVDEDGNPVAGTGPGGGAPTDARYIVTQLTGSLSDETLIGSIILAPGTLAARPSAAGLAAGTLYYSTEGPAYRADGAGAWVTLPSSGGGASFPLTYVGATAGTDAMDLRVTGDSVARLVINSDGSIQWGPGNAALNLTAAHESWLSTYPHFSVTGSIKSSAGLSVGGGGFDGVFMAGIYPLDSSRGGLRVRGAASQTASLQEWQDSAGTVRASISPAGKLFAYSVQMGAPGEAVYNNAQTSYVLYASGSPNSLHLAANAAHIPLAVRGAASQSANLQEWQSSTPATLAWVTAAGALHSSQAVVAASAGAHVQIGAVGPSFKSAIVFALAGDTSLYRDAADVLRTDDQFISVAPAAGTISDITRGTTAQTANLQEWQDSAGTMQLAITPIGAIKGGGSGVQLQRSTGGVVASFAFDNVALTEGGVFKVSNYNTGTYGATTSAINNYAGNISFLVRGHASQTASLQEWQNSAGTVLASISANGAFVQAFNPQTGTAYTLVAADAGDAVTTNNASANTVTVPQDSDAVYPIGAYTDIMQLGAGQTTVQAGTGATLRVSGLTAKARAQYSRLSVQKVAANTWSLMGDLAAA